MAYGSVSATGRAPVRARVRGVQRGGRRSVAALARPGTRSFAVPVRPLVGTYYVPPQYGLGDSDDDFAQFGGFSLKGIFRGIGKAATGVGHAVGKVVTSKPFQGVLGAGLALTGVGAPAAAGIFAATKGVGTLIKPGGTLKRAATGAAQGAVEGLTAAAARKVIPSIYNVGKGAVTGVVSRFLPSSTAPNVETVPATATQVAAAQDATAQAQAQAEAARQAAAAQVADLEAQRQAAQRAGDDARAAALQAQVAEATRQAAAATQAAQAAADAAGRVTSGVDPAQLQALVNAATQSAAAGQIAAAAPPTPDGTAQAQAAAGNATDAATDAAAGSPGGIDSSTMLYVIAGVAALALLSTRKRGR